MADTGSSQVLAQAVIAFVADDTQYQAAKAQILDTSQQMATGVGSVATAEDNVATSGVAAAAGIGTVAGAAKPAAVATGLLGDATRQTHQELFEAAKLMRSFADEIAAAYPGISGITGLFTRLSRETGGFSVAAVGATAVLLAAAAAVGVYIEQQTELIKTQAESNKLIAGGDYAGAAKGLSDIIDKMREWKVAQDANADFGQSQYSALTIGLVLLKNSFGVTTTEAKLLTVAADETWASFGQGHLSLLTTQADLEAMKAELVNIVATAPSLGALTDAFDAQDTVLRGLKQATIDLKLEEAERAKNAGVNEAQILGAKGLYKEALDKLAIVQQQYDGAQEIAASAEKAADEESATRKQANAEKLAGYVADAIKGAGDLAAAEAATAIAATKAQADQATAYQDNDKAAKDYQGTLLTGLTAYEVAHQASMALLTQQRIAALDAQHAADMAAEIEKLNALPAFGQAWEAEQRNLDLMEAAHDKARADLVAAGQLDEIKGLGAVTAATNAERTRQMDIATATFGLLKASGATSVQDEVAFMAQRVATWQDGGTKRIAAETDLANTVKKLHDDMASAGERLFAAAEASLKAQGIEYYSQNDILLEANKIKQQGQQLDAQALAGQQLSSDQWALIKTAAEATAESTKTGATFQQNITTLVTKWKEDLSGIPTTTGIIADNLGKVGVDVAGITTSLQGAAGAVAGFQQLSAAALGFVGAIGPTATAADNDFAVTLELLKIRADEAQGKMSGLTDTVTGFGDQLGPVMKDVGGIDVDFTAWGTEVQGTGAVLATFSTDATASLATAGTAFTDAGVAVKGFSSDVQAALDSGAIAFKSFGSGLEDGLKTALDGGIPMVRTFFDQLDAEVTAGASRIGDKLYQGLIDRLKNAIDSEALAS